MPLLGLYILPLGAFGVASGRWALVAPYVLGLLVYLVPSFRLRPKLNGFRLVLLTLPFLMLSNVWPYETRSGLSSNAMSYGSLYFYLLALLRLHAGEDDSQFARIWIFTSPLLACSGAEYRQTPYGCLVAAYALFSIWGFRDQMTRALGVRSRPRAVFIGLFLSVGLSFLMTFGSVAFLMAYYQDMIRFLYEGNVVRAGFSESTRLGSIQSSRREGVANTILLCCIGKGEPGYLRGGCYYTYVRGEWSTGRGSRSVKAASIPGRPKLGRVRLPERGYPKVTDPPFLAAFPAFGQGRWFFLPLDSAAVDLAGEGADLLPGNILRVIKGSSYLGYFVHKSEESALGRPGMPGAQSLQLPEDPFLISVLDEWIEEIFSGVPDGPSKLEGEAAFQAIEERFSDRYRYQFGIRFKKDSDPLVEFLTEKDHGHCELFASAGCLLLRRLGIPARYVTGYLCVEPTAMEDHWVARSRHAHAWVEYWQEGRGWKTAEFTPPSGLPVAEPEQGLAALWEAIKASVVPLWAGLRRLGLVGLLQWLGLTLLEGGRWVLAAWWRILLAVLGLVVFLLRKKAGLLSRSTRGEPERSFPTDIEAQREIFFRLQKKLKRKGYGKTEQETLREYAQRLQGAPLEDREKIVAFLSDFERMRYIDFECEGKR